MKDYPAIIERIKTTRQGLSSYFDKVYKLRRLVAGDVDALEDEGASLDPINDLRSPHISPRAPILVKDIQEGRSNKLLQAIRTLVLQTAHRFPEVEFENLEAEEAMVNVGYLQAILTDPPRGCGAVQHMQDALLDYMTGGLGFSWAGMSRGRPNITAVDTMLMAWDPTAKTLADSRWMSCTVSDSLGAWMEMFGDRAFDKYIAGVQKKDESLDEPVALEWYYDVEGAGNHCVLFKTGDEDIDAVPVAKGANPCYFEVDGERLPFIPFETAFFMKLPSVGQPIGLAEQMLPSQIALWRVEKKIRDLVDLPSFYEWVAGDFDQTEIDKFLEGETGSLLKKKKAGPGMELKNGAILDQPTLDWRSYHEKEMVAQSGANPYASGAPVEGTTYAAEVNAIQGAAGLMAGTIAKDNAGFWIRTVRKVLAMGKLYDTRPVTIRIEDFNAEFGPNFPIGEYLEPLAEIVIHEDSMQFMPREQKVAMAERDLTVAMSVSQLFPNAPVEAFQNWLKAKGEKNPAKWMKPPDPGMMMTQQPAPAVAGQA